MTDTQQTLFGGTAVIVLAGLVVYAMTRPAGVASGPAAPTAQIAAPESPPLYQLAPMDLNAIKQNPFNLSNPGSSVLFEFNDTYQYIQPGSQTGAVSAGGGSPNGVVGACNCPGNGEESFGDLQALASFMSPIMQKLVDQVPSGIVAPGILAPGKTTTFGAALHVWQEQRRAITNASNMIFSAGNSNAIPTN